MKSIYAVFGILICNSLFAQERVCSSIENWPYERLVAESDDIAIVTLKTTRDMDASETLGGRFPQRIRAAIKQVESEFVVKAALKGDPQESIVLQHYAWKDSPPAGGYDAAFASFRSKPERIEGESWVQVSNPRYLLFLRKLPSGKYVPAAGQVNMSNSVFRVLPVEVE